MVDLDAFPDNADERMIRMQKLMMKNEYFNLAPDGFSNLVMDNSVMSDCVSVKLDYHGHVLFLLFFLIFITDLHDPRHHCAPQRPPFLALEDLLQFEVDSTKVPPDGVLIVGLATHGTLAGVGVVESREALLDFLFVVSCNHVPDEVGHILRILATDLANLKMMTINKKRFKLSTNVYSSSKLRNLPSLP